MCLCSFPLMICVLPAPPWSQISDRIQRDRPPTLLSQFRSLEYALMVCAFVGVIGGGFFLATACFIQADRKRTELYAQGKSLFSSQAMQSFFCSRSCSYPLVAFQLSYWLKTHSYDAKGRRMGREISQFLVDHSRRGRNILQMLLYFFFCTS